MRQFCTLLLFSLLATQSIAQVSLDKPDLSTTTKIAPDYFGPNAFPVPDMLDGTTLSHLRIEAAVDYFVGHRGDKTEDIYFKAVVPLFSDRVNISLWLNSAVEWYQMSDESHEHSRLPDDIEMRGHEFGDAYISTDIHLMKQSEKRPDISLRVALKTALGYGYFKARYYDTPGYFFDTSVAKSFSVKSAVINEIRAVASAGFLCWQTDNGRQNDAVMYGLQVVLRGRHFSLSESFGGYSGWERDGDCPMSVKSQLNILTNRRIEPLFEFQYGLRDYPYSQFRVGFAYNFYGDF